MRNEDDEGTIEDESEEEESDDDEEAEGTKKLDDTLRKNLNELREQKANNLKDKQLLEIDLKGLRKQREDQDKKQREIQDKLEETEQDNLQFEREKMKKLNEIELHIMLRLDQIKNLDQMVDVHGSIQGGTVSYKGKIMSELARCVMFTKNQLKGLSNRENELKDE